MLSARLSTEKKKSYVVKYGYVYSDSHGNHYKAGDIVDLSEKQFDLAKHRVTPLVSEKQAAKEAEPRAVAKIYPSHKQEVEKEEVKKPEQLSQTVAKDSVKLDGILGQGKYLIK